MKRTISQRNGKLYKVEERILKTGKNRKGYLQVSLIKNGIEKRISVHKIVAEAFIPNALNLPQVNHKDENKENNYASNLEWCDCSYNNNYGNHYENVSNSLKKPVYQFDLQGNFIKEWEGIIDVEKELGYNHSLISRVCKGKYKSAYKYIWKYKEAE